MADAELYDEFGNYVGPELSDDEVSRDSPPAGDLAWP